MPAAAEGGADGPDERSKAKLDSDLMTAEGRGRYGERGL